MQGYFSQRYGYKKIQKLKIDEMPDSLRNRLWNYIMFTIAHAAKINKDVYNHITLITWDSFFKRSIDEIINMRRHTDKLNLIKNKFFELEWYEVYDFIEFLLKEKVFDKLIDKQTLVKTINWVFLEEGVQARIVDSKIIPNFSEEELKEIEKTLIETENRYKPSYNELKKAIEFYSKRPNPDYKKSIEASIHSIEALAKIITGDSSATLGKIAKELPIHPALRDGIEKLYGWASDEGGVRHSEKQYPPLSAGEEEARFMLILASALINYIITKYEQKQ